MRTTLREITSDNEAGVRALRTSAAQEQFVSTVDYTLREAASNPQDNPWLRAIYTEEQPVGLVMLAWDIVPQPPETHGPWYLWKLLVDERHQGKGYGRDAVQQVMDLIRAAGAEELMTSYIPGDGGPAGFYAKLGFVPKGERNSEDEVVLRLRL